MSNSEGGNSASHGNFLLVDNCFSSEQRWRVTRIILVPRNHLKNLQIIYQSINILVIKLAASPVRQLSQRTEYIIEGIDAIKRRGSVGECFIVSAYVVTRYWSEAISKGAFIDDYDEVRRACDPLMNDELGIPPRRVDDVVRIIEEIALPNSNIHFRVDHLKDLTIRELETFVQKREPPIPIYDMHLLQFQSPSSIMHCSVMVGYNVHSLIVNDDQYGYRYSLQRDRFAPSWDNIQFKRKAILVRPEEPSYKIDTMLEEAVKRKDVAGH